MYSSSGTRNLILTERELTTGENVSNPVREVMDSTMHILTKEAYL